MGNLLRCARARAHLRALMTRKSCAVGMRNAILRNHLRVHVWGILWCTLYNSALLFVFVPQVSPSDLEPEIQMMTKETKLFYNKGL